MKQTKRPGEIWFNVVLPGEKKRDGSVGEAGMSHESTDNHF